MKRRVFSLALSLFFSVTAMPAAFAALPPNPSTKPLTKPVPKASSEPLEEAPITLEAPPSMLPEASPSVDASASAPIKKIENSVKLGALYLENDRQAGIAKAKGEVKLEFKDMVIETEEIFYDQRNKRAWTEVPFTLTQTKDGKTQIVTGKKLDYSFTEEIASVTDATLTMPAKTPGQMIYISAKELQSIKRGKFVIKGGVFTTCDAIQEEKIPHYHINAEKMEVIPDVSLMGWNTTFFVNNRPVMYLPFYWVPLNKQENNFELGQNDIEGRFLKTWLGYGINPYHTGTVFNNIMEHKKYGVGFDHLWKADPNSQTALTLYGLPYPDQDDGPLNTEYPSQNWEKYGLTGTAFQDHLFKVQHQQNLGSLRLDLKYEDMNMYSFRNLPKNVPAGTDRRSFATQLREVYNSHDLNLTDNRNGVNYGLGRSFREAKSNGTVSTNHTGKFSTNVGGVKVDGNTNWNQTQSWISPLDPASKKANPRTDWTNNMTFSHSVQDGPATTLTLNHWKRENPLSTPDEQMDPTLTIRQNLGWGNATLTAQKRLDFSPNALNPSTIKSRGYIDKLPELVVESNSIGENFQPVRLKLGLGRYFESGNYDPTNPLKSYTTSPINRFNPELSLVNKQHDVGIGKLDFGGSGLKQFVYSTGDAQYALNFNSALNSDWGDHLATNLSYNKVQTPKNNNTPLKSDSLGLQKRTELSGNVVVKGAKKEDGSSDFNWTTSMGYDYETQRYSALNTNLLYNPARRLNLTMQSGYDFEDTPYLSLKNGRWSPLGMTLNLRSTDEEFGGAFGQNTITPGWELSNTLSYDFMKGEWGSLQNNLRFIFGNNWQNHWELTVTGAYDYGGTINGIQTEKGYHLNEISLNKDLHDYILSLSYNRQAQAYMLRLTMLAFGQDLFNFNKSGFGQ